MLSASNAPAAGVIFAAADVYNLHICSVRSISARPEETEYIVINEISSLIRNALRTLSGGRRRLDEIETEIENLMRRCSLAAETSMKYINRRISQLEQEKKNPPAAAIFYPRLPCGCAVSANSQKTKKRPPHFDRPHRNQRKRSGYLLETAADN